MKLIYRGTTYDRNPNKAPSRPFQPASRSGEAYNITYRGVTYRVDPNATASVPVKPVAYELIYRGTTYLVNRNAQGEVATVTQPRNRKSNIFPQPAKSSSLDSIGA